MAWLPELMWSHLPDSAIEFHSTVNPEYTVEVDVDSLFAFGPPRDPSDQVMFAHDYPDLIGAHLEDQKIIEIEEDPEEHRTTKQIEADLREFMTLPMIKVEWSLEFNPGSGRRRKPNKRIRHQLLTLQGNRCLYCRLEFGSWVERFKRSRRQLELLNVCWDHRIPFILTQSSAPREFVAACQVCNFLKAALIFQTLEDAREYISSRRARKGWRLA